MTPRIQDLYFLYFLLYIWKLPMFGVCLCVFGWLCDVHADAVVLPRPEKPSLGLGARIFL